MNWRANIRIVRGHLRLLPAVMVCCGLLIAVKAATAIGEARAAAAAPAASPAPAVQADSKPAPATQDAAVPETGSSAAEVDVLTSLGKRRRALDDEARQLDMRANLLTATEKRIDGKIAELKALQAQIQDLLVQHDDAKKKQIASLVKVYSAMKPADAGRLFNSLDDSVLIEVAGGMKPDVLAPVMAAMSPDKAQALTVKLADRLNLPKASAVTVPQQVAAAASAPAPAASPPASAAAPPQVNPPKAPAPVPAKK